MISKSIAVNEHDDFLIGVNIFINKPDLAMFGYKHTNKQFMNNE